MNRLAGSQSPYLLQHADNPVDWWPWSPAAFEEARRRDVPVLLSVGYSSCHWCHVMAGESFEDVTTATYMNAHFVNIKVDREERPDVDAVYMEAVQAATGQGGWPMTVFLNADGEPFYFGTYFPPAPRSGMASFPQVLEGVSAAWTDRRDEVAEVAGRIVAELSERSLAHNAGGTPAPDDLTKSLRVLAREYDDEHGGFGGAPKFPPSMALEFLLRHHARVSADADSGAASGTDGGRTDGTAPGGALRMAADTCEAMARGGIFDQLGGGFARYSVDREWIVPHFEKMLYDNALLCRVYAHLWRATGSELARRVAVRTADFIVRELRTEEGGFASALDADSDDGSGRHVEGAFYVWTPEQLREVLGDEDAEFAARLYGVTERGTFEKGASVLQLPRDGGSSDASARAESVRARLLAAREQRPRPGRDDKVVAAWNGLAIAALAETGAYFDRPDLVERATEAADLLVRLHLDQTARLSRTSRDGKPGPNAGVLEDYGDVAEGFLTLAAVTGEGVWLEFSGFLLDTVLDRFAADDGGLYDTAHDAERLIRRPQDPTDNATPSGWTAAAGALLSYAAHTGSERHRTAAENALGVVKAIGPRAPRFIGWGLAVAEALLAGPREIAVVGPADDPATAELHRTALLATVPGAVVAAGEAGGPEFPLLTDRPLVGGRPAAYVCRHFVCAAPTTEVDVLKAELGVRV